jgi:competence protein ComEC
MDDIKRKLDLIDQQLAGGPNLLERIITTSPLAIVASGLIAGILIQNALFESRAASQEFRILWLWTSLLVFFATAAVLIFAVNKKNKSNSLAPVLLSTCALVCFACLGAIRLTAFYKARPDDIRNLVGNEQKLATENPSTALRAGAEKKINHELTQTDTNKRADEELVTPLSSVKDRKGGENSWQKLLLSADSAVKESDAKLATIRGLIITEPYTNNYGYTAEPNRPDANEIDKSKDYKGVYRQWKFAIFQFTDPTCSFYLKVREVETVNGWAKVTGTVRVQVDEPVLDLKAGDYVQMYCWLDRFRQPTNPGQFNTAKNLARKGVFVAASVPTREAIELLKKNSSAGTFIKMKRRLQEIAGQALRGDLDIEGQNYALLQALVLGYRTEIDSDTYRAFQKTGLLHFLCLSGMNFMILFWIIWWLCKTAGLMKRAGAVICLAAAGLFLLVIPPQPPAFRAAIMSFVFCISFFFRRKSNPFNSLSLAAIILLLIRPTDLFEAGWQLSFASVLGILLFAKPIENFINEKVAALLEDPTTGKLRPYSHIISRLTLSVIAVFSVSLAAWLASTGILLHHFYRINYLTSTWTVIVSPLIGALSILGYFKIILGLFLPSAAAMLDILIKPLSDLLIWVVKLFAGLNISEIIIGKVSSAVIILYYGFLVFIFFGYFRRPRVKKLICTMAAVGIIIFLGATKWHRTYRDNLVLTCLDVGHGQAILAQLPGRTNILFDAGSLQRANVGGRIIAPFLDYSGISKIDAIIISHSDIDHINGIPEIIEHCKVGHVYANDAFFDEIDQWGSTKFLNDWLIKKDPKLKIRRLENGLKPDSPANIKILWPMMQINVEQLSDNDKSLVSLIEFAGKKILLCSDIEKFAQAQLLATIPDLKADIVIVPHHGSTRTSYTHFLEKLGPDISIVSCDRTQYERQLAATRKDNAKSFYTARDGAIAVCINKNGTIRTTTLSQLN